MGHPIEHAVGIYIGLLLIACLVAIISRRLSHLPYTIFLVIVGLAVGLLPFGPEIEETGFSHDLIFFVFLPPLLFQGAFHMRLDRLLEQFWPIFCFAIPGVIVSTLLVGGVVHWMGGIHSLMVALLFGALISPTDPVSVLSLFRDIGAPEDLKTLVEGESLFNDATGVVLFTILLEVIVEGQRLGLGEAAIQFLQVSGGGLLLGAGLGLVVFTLMRYLEDHLLENTLCLVLAYGAFWMAEVLHISGVIATVMAGLMMGNYGRHLSMSKKTTETVETFFESIDFIINSLLFILIGLELREVSQAIPWITVLSAVAGMLLGRALVTYGLYWILNQIGTKRPRRWKHILFWGGLRGSIPIALLLHLPAEGMLAEWRTTLLMAGFGCVFFSLVVQGVTVGPLMRKLGVVGVNGSVEKSPLKDS
ncbi:MAG: sodium:proton antiporter [Desulfatiglans sp.]|jgi:CPA1 family monovalent cation:H+ antiporter|nr:sodium:proton antiporter [Desulfatiglans sp.]